MLERRPAERFPAMRIFGLFAGVNLLLVLALPAIRADVPSAA